MPTIAEIIAARQAAAASPAPAGATCRTPKESIAQRLEASEAIDRIDPPGKFAARKSAGLILSQEMPLPAAEVAQKAHYANQRMEVPSGVTQPSNDQPMCVVLEGRTVWLCMPCEDPTTPPIKVLRLPLAVWPYPAAQPLPEGEPF